MTSAAKQPATNPIKEYAVPLATGLVFGWCLERSKVYLPTMITTQMTLGSFTMLKMFLAATVTGMVVIASLQSFPSIKSRIVKPPTCFGLGYHGYGSNLVGGAILGIGMTLSGACPGTLLTQIGAGLINWWAITGALAGTLFVGPVSKIMKSMFVDHGKKSAPVTVDALLSSSYQSTAFKVGGAFVLIIAAAEYWVDWRRDIAVYLGPDAVATAWNPVWAGLLLGLMQLPLIGYVGDRMLGTSRGWATVVGELAGKAGLASGLCVANPAAWWQVVMDLGIIGGAYLSVQNSGFITPAVSNGPLSSFLGGFFVLFGGRFGGGCTSGHGLSGMAQLSLSSFITVAAMFAGGMGSAYLLGL